MTDVKKDILWRLNLTFTLLLLLGSAIVAQIIKVQFVQGDSYRAMADSTQLDYRTIPAKRGNIYAQGGDLLAASFPYYIVSMDPTVVAPSSFAEGIDSLALGLADILGERNSSWYKKRIVDARNSGRQYVVIDNKVSVPQLIALRELPIFRKGRYRGGFMYTGIEKRERPYGSLASRTVGYVKSGTNVGIEGAFDEQLSGTPGRQLMRKVSGGVWMPMTDETEIDPHDGLDIVTTIDVNVQDITENALRHSLVKNAASWGTAVVMEVKTGKVRAISNLTRQKDGSYEEVLNYAIGERVEPGSTFKLFSLMALIEDGYVDLNDSVDLNKGHISYYKRNMWDSEGAHNYNNVTIKTAFAKSSNVGISRLVNEYYKDNPTKYLAHLERSGLNQATGIPLIGEPAPVFKMDPKASDWYGTTLPWMSVGYELRITPLQMLTFYNAIANGGKVMQPQFVEGTARYGEIVDVFNPVVLVEKICSDKTLQQMRVCLEAVVDSGTARRLKNDYYKIAGKTGTAQILVDGTYSSGQYLASFIGYFPADNPKYTIAVVVSNPTMGIYYGGAVAGTVFKEVSDKVYAHHLNIIDPLNASDSLPKGFIVKGSGYSEDIDIILREMDLQLPEVHDDFVEASVNEQSLSLSSIAVAEKVMPSVKNMGLRDALYLLEKQGLNVQVIGKGKVKYQSIPAGQSIRKGLEVTIRLG